MKFGGTSVADPDAINRLIGIVRQQQAKATARAARRRVGAGRSHRQAGGDRATGRRRRVGEAPREVKALLERHLSVATAVTSASRGERSPMSASRVRRAERPGARALAVLREVSPRSRDAVHAVGEVVSSRIVAPPSPITALPAPGSTRGRCSITDAEHNAAAPDMMETARAGERRRSRR